MSRVIARELRLEADCMALNMKKAKSLQLMLRKEKVSMESFMAGKTKLGDQAL